MSLSNTCPHTWKCTEKKTDLTHLTGCLSISDQPQQVNEPQIALGLHWAIGTVLPTPLTTSGCVGEWASDLKLVDVKYVNSHVFSSQRTWGCDIIPLQERYTAQDMQVGGTCLLSIDCCRLYHLQHFHPMIEASCGHTCYIRYVRSRALEIGNYSFPQNRVVAHKIACQPLGWYSSCLSRACCVILIRAPWVQWHFFLDPAR